MKTLEELIALVDEFGFNAGKFAIGIAEGIQPGTPDHAILSQGHDKHRSTLESALRELIADAERLNQENFALAAGQCIVPVGGLYGDDRGHQHCGLQKKLERTEQLLKEALSEQISRQQDEDDNQVPDAAFGQCPTCGEYSQSAKELRRHRRRP